MAQNIFFFWWGGKNITLIQVRNVNLAETWNNTGPHSLLDKEVYIFFFFLAHEVKSSDWYSVYIRISVEDYILDLSCGYTEFLFLIICLIKWTVSPNEILNRKSLESSFLQQMKLLLPTVIPEVHVMGDTVKRRDSSLGMNEENSNGFQLIRQHPDKFQSPTPSCSLSCWQMSCYPRGVTNLVTKRQL